MVGRVRRLLSGKRLPLALLVVAAVGAGAYVAVTELGSEEEEPQAPAPPVVVREAPEPPEDEEDAADLGFPEFATSNTTRVAGADPLAAAAGVALATFPSTGGLDGPAAVSLVDSEDWAGGIAAASLVAEPVGAPILLTESGETPELTASALEALAPRGSDATGDSAAFRIGEAAKQDLKTEVVPQGSPAEVAARIEALRRRLVGSKPTHLLVTASDAPEFAMPAAGWAARSGDPVLFAGRKAVPKATLEAIGRNKDVPVFVLGPSDAIGAKAFGQIEKAAPGAQRIAAPDPVESAIAFARFSAGAFGWNINDPGHGFVVASTQRPADAAAAAALSASGTWGPLLLTDDPQRLPQALRNYMLDVKPGYQDDPTRALYNHIWLVGDERAISVEQQAQLDELAEVVRVRSGSGASLLGPAPGTPEDEGEPAGPGRGGGPGGARGD